MPRKHWLHGGRSPMAADELPPRVLPFDPLLLRTAVGFSAPGLGLYEIDSTVCGLVKGESNTSQMEADDAEADR